ncbi:hypothetical protein QQF64_017442 [Cirrhinus molitorella]|uniref:Uncharacterized protein n=1 Tax=Cirrhinus molitorella TaxID=172907 RepID=A0ABR3LM03_9TELE
MSHQTNTMKPTFNGTFTLPSVSLVHMLLHWQSPRILCCHGKHAFLEVQPPSPSTQQHSLSLTHMLTSSQSPFPIPL